LSHNSFSIARVNFWFIIDIIAVNFTKSNTGYLMTTNYRKWQSHDVEFIEKNYSKMTDKSISVILSKITGDNISVDMVRRQRRKLGLNRQKGRPKK